MFLIRASRAPFFRQKLLRVWSFIRQLRVGNLGFLNILFKIWDVMSLKLIRQTSKIRYLMKIKKMYEGTVEEVPIFNITT